MKHTTARFLLLPLLAVACAAPEQPTIEAVQATGSVMRTQHGLEALQRFVPARQPVLDGGECVDRSVTETGTRMLSVHFPNRREPDTGISLWLDSTGKVLRYSEGRGWARPNRDLAAMRAEHAGMIQTHVQLDYVTGQAMAANSVPDQPSQGVIGDVSEFERTDVLGDLPARAELVRRICGQT